GAQFSPAPNTRLSSPDRHPHPGRELEFTNLSLPTAGTPMPTVRVPDDVAPSPFTKAPGSQPLPGYVLTEPLGRGGLGEVWKCEAPGGLHKAIKFVLPTAGGHQLQQELAAFEQIKAVRHPFLLTLERVELVGGELVMVMELADRHLGERFQECRAA